MLNMRKEKKAESRNEEVGWRRSTRSFDQTRDDSKFEKLLPEVVLKFGDTRLALTMLIYRVIP